MNYYILDTNVILRFLLADDDSQSPTAKAYILNENNHFVISTVVFCEVVWVMKKHSKLTNEQIILYLKSLAANHRMNYDKVAFDNGIAFLGHGGDFADGVIAQSNESFSSAKLLTFDKKSASISQKLALNVQLL